MKIQQALAIVLVVALLVLAVKPAPAEAMDAVTIALIAAGGVVVLILVMYLVAANVAEARRGGAAVPGPDGRILVVLGPAATQTP